MTEANRPVALITGAATGVGRACAIQFAKRGFDVVINYSKSELEAKETALGVEACGTKAVLICCDVSNDLNVRKMLKEIGGIFGRLDVLVNNAATTKFIPHADMESLTEEIWDRMFDVNLKGAFFVTRAAADLLKAGEGGAVVNISSVAATTGSGSSIAYCASKAGLNTMTKSFSKVLAPKVRVNAVCPGPIDTRWIKEGCPSLDLDKMVAGYPLPRASQPEDIADAVVFLALDTKMATGQLLTVDGGQTL